MVVVSALVIEGKSGAMMEGVVTTGRPQMAVVVPRAQQNTYGITSGTCRIASV
jgi:hypothetical protein